MTTNTNPSRTAPARFFASATPNANGLYVITDRDAKGTAAVVAYVKGRATARAQAAQLTAIDPSAIRPTDEPKPEPADDAKRTSHAACAHVSTKLARAICRRERAKADATN